jgi:hypothetical protein
VSFLTLCVIRKKGHDCSDVSAANPEVELTYIKVKKIGSGLRRPDKKQSVDKEALAYERAQRRYL